jgi:Tol biopolymer transport system component
MGSFAMGLAAAVATVSLPASASGAVDDTLLASRADGAAGAAAAASSSGAAISADGCRIAFTTAASLAPGDSNGVGDVYMRDLCAGQTALVSRAGTTQTAGDGASGSPAISADGETVAFTSAADLDGTGLDAKGGHDVYARDLDSGSIEVVSLSSSGRQHYDGSDPSVSGDGRIVAFSSATPASQFDPTVKRDGNDNADDHDVFVRDRSAHTTRLVSRNGDTTGSGASILPSVSGDGTRVAFQSAATNLGPADANGAEDVYVRDLPSETNLLVSRGDGAAGAQGDAGSLAPAISLDGDHVAFTSAAANLDGGSASSTDAFVRDLGAADTELVSRSSGTVGPPMASGAAASPRLGISADGRFVAFAATDTGIAEGAEPVGANVFVRDRLNRTTFLASRAAGGEGPGADAPSGGAGISADGRFVSFDTAATNLGGGAAGGVFRRELGEPSGVTEGQSVNLRPLAGTVWVKLPGHKDFVLIEHAVQVPVGTLVGSRGGRVELTDDYNGVKESAKFFGGVFQIQQHAGEVPVLTADLRGKLPGCKSKASGRMRSAPLAHTASTKGRSLWGSGKGHYRTRGSRGAATVRGTVWLTSDRCNGSTAFKVLEGFLAINDFGSKGSVDKVLYAPGRYVASAK